MTEINVEEIGKIVDTVTDHLTITHNLSTGPGCRNSFREKAERLVSLACTLITQTRGLDSNDAVRVLAVALASTDIDGGGSEVAASVAVDTRLTPMELALSLGEIGVDVTYRQVFDWSDEDRAEVEKWVTQVQLAPDLESRSPRPWMLP